MAIQSKSASGTAVTLTGIEDLGYPTVDVRFTHPSAGAIHFTSTNYGSVKGQQGIIGHWGRQQVCVTVPKSDFDAAFAEARAIGQKEIADLKSGAALIQCRWADGDPLSGWSTGGRAAGLLKEIGLAEDVSGWGYLVKKELVEALGESFTYAQALEFIRPALEAKERKRNEKVTDRQSKFDEAVRTGQSVLLRTWTEDCDGSAPECSLDQCREYALPNGQTKTTRVHTH